MENIRYEFIMSQIKVIRDIKETEKVKISLVFYDGIGDVCVLKVCKNRDLSEVYQVLMKTTHTNLAQVYDCVYENGDTYILEEYIKGQTLAERLEQDGRFTESDTSQMICNLCDALTVLHSHDPAIIHNDIKPSNIMIDEDGIVKLFDFDISRIYKTGSYKNTNLMGTYEYAAPEHYGFGQSEPETDIYSLGVTMHEMLTGAGLDCDHAVTYQGRLSKIIQKCVEIDRKNRYASAELLKTELEKSSKKALPMYFWPIMGVCVAALVLLGVAFAAVGLRDTAGENIVTGTQETGSLGLVHSDLVDMETSDTSAMEMSTETLTEATTETMTEVTTEGKPKDKTQNNSEKDTSASDKDKGSDKDDNKNKKPDKTEDKDKNTIKDTNKDTNKDNSNNSNNNSNKDSVNNSENKNSESATTEDSGKKMETVYEIEDTFLAMNAWSDGTFLVFEKISDEYYLTKSDGTQKKLSGVKSSYASQLEYNPYTDQMYLFAFEFSGWVAYEVSRNLELTAVYQEKFQGLQGMDVAFFSDGRLYINRLILSGEDWSIIEAGGNAMWPILIKDKLYSFQYDEKYLYHFYVYDDEWNLVEDYPIKEAGAYYLGPDSHWALYRTSKAAYIIAAKEKDKKEYIYRFDGKTFTPLACLSEYSGYKSGNYTALCVTDTALRYYSKTLKAIVEFKFE